MVLISPFILLKLYTIGLGGMSPIMVATVAASLNRWNYSRTLKLPPVVFQASSFGFHLLHSPKFAALRVSVSVVVRRFLFVALPPDSSPTYVAIHAQIYVPFLPRVPQPIRGSFRGPAACINRKPSDQE